MKVMFYFLHALQMAEEKSYFSTEIASSFQMYVSAEVDYFFSQFWIFPTAIYSLLLLHHPPKCCVNK